MLKALSQSVLGWQMIAQRDGSGMKRIPLVAAKNLVS